MTFRLSAASLDNMVGVEPRLVRVVKRAILITPVDFKVIEGVRSDARAYENFGKGRTVAQCLAAGCPAKYARPALDKVTWVVNPLSTKHRRQKDGWGHAVDLLPAPYDWAEGPGWKQLNAAMMKAADIEGVPIRWGRDWDGDGVIGEKGETDGPHWELR